MITLTDEEALSMLRVFLYAEDGDFHSLEEASIYLAGNETIAALRAMNGKQIEITIKLAGRDAQ